MPLLRPLAPWRHALFLAAMLAAMLADGRTEALAQVGQPRPDAPAAEQAGPAETGRPSTDIDANGAVHAATGFVLPSRLAGAFLTQAVDYAAPPTNDAKLGVSYHYSAPGPILVSVFIYNAGQTPGDGAADPWVQGHFQLAQREMLEIAKTQNRYQNLTMVSPPRECGGDTLRFLCVGFAALVQGQPTYTALLLTGFHGYYLKVRVDWPNDPAAPNAVAELLDELEKAQKR